MFAFCRVANQGRSTENGNCKEKGCGSTQWDQKVAGWRL
jgi:hypothetical protein